MRVPEGLLRTPVSQVRYVVQRSALLCHAVMSCAGACLPAAAWRQVSGCQPPAELGHGNPRGFRRHRPQGCD